MPLAGMPISDLPPPVADPVYVASLDAFAARHVTRRGLNGAVQAYHAVRNMPYFSGPDRTPLAALQTGQGACTAKHLLLRDLLLRLAFDADVALVDCDFARGVPAHASMPDALRAVAGQGGVRDMHCWVRLRAAEPLLLDATWPDALGRFGFPVNTGWTGAGDTRPAVEGGVVRGVSADVLQRKQELLAELSDQETVRRQTFLRNLSVWLANIEVDEGGNRT